MQIQNRGKTPSLLVWLSVFAFSALSFASPPIQDSYTKRDAVRFVMDDYCRNDCAGYLSTHSSWFRRTFEKALNGDNAALKRVFTDGRFHSGDNEAWEAVPGNILFVVGDRCFSNFLAELDKKEQRSALMKIPIAAPFYEAYEAGDHAYFKTHFPATYRLYALHFPEFAE